MSVSASKGIENDTLRTMSEVLEEVLPPETAGRAVFLSGPSFAREVAAGMPTAVVAASRMGEAAREVQEVFSTRSFRVYTNDDVVGVELGGALKNVIALAAGVSDGLGFGYNTRAALITRGLAEISRMGLALGANPATFSGLAGMGDLVLTCTGDLSRNRTVGMELGRGKSLQEVLAGMKMVAEGVKTTLSAYQLARKLKVEVPITEQMYQDPLRGQGPPAGGDRPDAEGAEGRGIGFKAGEKPAFAKAMAWHAPIWCVPLIPAQRRFFQVCLIPRDCGRLAPGHF